MPEIRIYTSDNCIYCERAKRLLEGKDAPYEEINVSGNDQLRMDLVKMSGGLRTVPQIWIGERHVGGFDRLSELERSGELDKLLGR